MTLLLIIPLYDRNGIPIVQLGAPNEYDISLINFEKLDISEKNLIFNNSPITVETESIGFISGNPHLKNRAASLIIARVTQPNSSFLNGTLEVAGKKAEVIIANPWGLTCNGCGFLHTSATTLTTGQLQFSTDRKLQHFIVGKGNILVTEKGFNAEQLDSLNLVSRTLTLNGKITLPEERNLSLSLSSQEYEAKTGGKSLPVSYSPVEEYLLDVGELGGMYAGRIVITGTEPASGIRFNGQLQAKEGIHINYHGDF